MIGIIMKVPIQPVLAASGTITATALADLLGHWSAPEGPLYRLLAARLARLADTGALTAGLRLPAERDLAARLSVSRNTVAMAYQALRDEGMAESRQGSGTRIVPHRTTPAATHRANGFFTSLLESSAVRADLTLALAECAPQVAAAITAPSTVLSRGELRAITATHGYHPLGLPELRAAIAWMLTSRHALPTVPEEVIVTTGGQQAIDLLVRAEVAPGSAAIVEEPTFAGVIDILHRADARLVGMTPGDTDQLDHLLRTHAPALAYLIPTHHNPVGCVMAEDDRRRVVKYAEQNPDTTVVDDVTLAELALDDGQRPAPLAAFAPRQPNIVTVGSLSKSYWGGLRTGWVRAPAGIIARLGAAKAAADLGSPVLEQAVAAALIREQHDDIIGWRQDWLRPRYEALTSALTEHLPSWRWPRPDGGPALWVQIPCDEGAFTQAALRAGVAVLPGRLVTIGTRPTRHLRLAFTAAPAVLTNAVATLATVPGSY
jgi:DNA-binding transcriptional MocR family regulator